jgi:hypothetical protein
MQFDYGKHLSIVNVLYVYVVITCHILVIGMVRYAYEGTHPTYTKIFYKLNRIPI